MKFFEEISDWWTYDEGRIRTLMIFAALHIPIIIAIVGMFLKHISIWNGLLMISLMVVQITILYLFRVKPWVKKRKAEEQARQERLDKNIKNCKDSLKEINNIVAKEISDE